MKIKHNKKRNTAFLYEVLTKEVAKAIVAKDIEKKKSLLSLMKEFFSKGKVLRQELELYKLLGESHGADIYFAERLIQEAKKEYISLDKEKIFEAQSNIIKMINENFGTKIYSNFVPNYRNLATISQIFGAEIGVKHKVLLERAIIQGIVSKPEEVVESKSMPHVDDLVYRKVVESFNAKYSEQLDENQKELIGKYVTLFADNSIEFKVYLNEELHRLKEEVKKMSDAEDISGDKDMQQKVALVSEKMESFKGQPIDDKMIQQVLKIQALTRETVL
jgi:hypothetical protein|tara:strand:+ start:464 stop:1291 length:828 start_codon:yes stop_codon:yes gene_type:complete